MAIQLILCVETNKKADTDSKYIFETIKYYYNIDNSVKLSKIYMGTKTKYNSKEVLKEIKQKKSMFSHGNSMVIYCIDTDQFEKNPDHKKEYDAIQKYCIHENYEMIWFCHDVEEVFVGYKVSDSEKTKAASEFVKKKIVESLNDKKLSSNNLIKNTSNMLLVFDKYLQRRH